MSFPDKTSSFSHPDYGGGCRYNNASISRETKVVSMDKSYEQGKKTQFEPVTLSSHLGKKFRVASFATLLPVNELRHFVGAIHRRINKSIDSKGSCKSSLFQKGNVGLCHSTTDPRYLRKHVDNRNNDGNSMSAVFINPEKDVRVELIGVLHPAKTKRKFLLLKELFSRFKPVVESDAVRSKIKEFEKDYENHHQNLMCDFEHIPSDFCTLNDVYRHIEHCCKKQQDVLSDHATIMLSVTINCIGYSKGIQSALITWPKVVVETVHKKSV